MEVSEILYLQGFCISGVLFLSWFRYIFLNLELFFIPMCSNCYCVVTGILNERADFVLLHWNI